MLFINKIVGTKGIYTNSDIEGYLKNIIVSRLTNIIGDELKSVFDMPSSFDDLSLITRTKLQAEFDGLGLSLHDFYINSISLPDDVQKLIDQRSGMSAIGDMDEFMKYKVALALENASQNQSGTGELMGGGLGAGMGLGMGFMMPQMIQQSMMPSIQGTSEKGTAIDKLKKLKELLDLGVISQDEFNQKKKKLMDQI